MSLACAASAAAQNPTPPPTPIPDSARVAQAAMPPQPAVGPAIRRISTASAVSKEKIGSIVGVRELPDGRVLVNDGTSRRLLLLDTLLVLERVVLDSASEKENTYGNRQGALIPHRGDSTIFIDPQSLALLVIDPAGNIARVRSVPRAQDTYLYAGGQQQFGQPAIDPKGRLIYRMYAEAAPPAKAPPKGVPWFPQEPDSAFIVGLDLDTRKLDTLGVIRTPKTEFMVRLSPNGGFNFFTSINPMPAQDEWAVLPDGAIALVRAIDYRIDYLNADGTRTSSPKLPYEWQPLSDDEKQRIVDSVRNTQSRNARTQYVTSVIRYVNTYGKPYPPNFSAPDGYVPPNGFAKDWKFPANVKFPEKYIYGCPLGVEPTITQGPGGAGAQPANPNAAAVMERMAMAGMPMPAGMPGMPNLPPGATPSCIPMPIPDLNRVPQPPQMREVSVISPKALPDFRPPFNSNSVRADMDGGLWIRANPAKPAPPSAGAVFDIVTREGQLVDRLQLPQGHTVAGFGRGKVVFLTMRDASGIHLARVRLK